VRACRCQCGATEDAVGGESCTYSAAEDGGSYKDGNYNRRDYNAVFATGGPC